MPADADDAGAGIRAAEDAADATNAIAVAAAAMVAAVAVVHTIDPDRSCHCSSLALWHSTDYQTLRYPRAVNPQCSYALVLAPIPSIDYAADNHVRFHARICWNRTIQLNRSRQQTTK